MSSKVLLKDIVLPIPDDPYEVETAWFERLMACHGLDVSIRSVAAVGIGGGLMGRNVRYRFEYAKADDEAPASLVGKFPSVNAMTLKSEGLARSYSQEVNFYRDFGARAGNISPKAWYADIAPGSLQFAILLQDLSPLQNVTLTGGCNRDDAKIAMEMAAALHASHWQDPALDSVSWISGTSDRPAEVLPKEILQQCWVEFQSRYRGRVSPRQLEVGHCFVKHFVRWRDGYTGPVCLVHRDFRLENVLFSEGGASRAAATVDWAIVAVAAPAIDVAFFIGTSLTESVRRSSEQSLIEHYHAALVRKGVTDYGFAELREHYARFAYWGVNVAIGSMMFDRTEESDEMLFAMFTRQAELIADNNFLL